MKISIIAMIGLTVVFAVTSCKKDGDKAPVTFNNRSTAAADYQGACGLPVVPVTADIVSSITWGKDSVYELTGVITVRNGATLTIEPGTYIKSSVNTPGVANGVLVIAKNGKINAVGTPVEPIVFTSRRLLDCITSTYGAPGDFGGIVILGNAKVNVQNKLVEGLPDDPRYRYGGYNDYDNRGKLQYVRIEFSGFGKSNGLTLGAVGNGTTIDHVQVAYGAEDGFGFFGGTVNPTHLVSFGAEDDQFNFNNGYRGTIKYAIGAIDAYSSHKANGTLSDANGIESENNAAAEDAGFKLKPKTNPTLKNFSIIGIATSVLNPPVPAPGLNTAFHSRAGADASIYNSLFTGYPRGVIFDSQVSADCESANVSAHGFITAVTPGYYPYGLLTAVSDTASKWNMAQPFYNVYVAPLDYTTVTGSRGAITTGTGNWLTDWAKFDY